MPRDHYVSQVHLRHFCLPENHKRLNAFRKSDGFNFLASTESVCQIEDGSTNEYLTLSRIVEEVLNEIEPKYNIAIDSLVRGSHSSADVVAISGFIAYVETCSPTAQRLASVPLVDSLQMTAEVLESQGHFPPPPAALEAASLSELIQAGAVGFHVDPKFPQAIGIANIMDIASTLADCAWDIIHNDNDDSKFFSSDFPVVTLPSYSGGASAKIVPLTPSLAVRLHPKRRGTSSSNLKLRHHRSRTIRATRQDAIEINRWIIRAAEKLVFCPRSYEWAGRFVQRNRAFRSDARTFRLPSREGAAQLATLGVFPHSG